MRQRIHILILALAAMLITAQPAFSAAKGWEQVKTERADAKSVIKDTDIEVKAMRGAVIISTNHAVSVKIITILGRTVSSETLQPGTWQLNVAAHGVYILKVGDITCKAAL